MGTLYLITFLIAPLVLGWISAKVLARRREPPFLSRKAQWAIGLGVALGLYLLEAALFMRFLGCMDGC